MYELIFNMITSDKSTQSNTLISNPSITRKSLNRSGFTLIEFMLYLAITVTMIGLIGDMGIIVFESRTKAYVLEETNYSVAYSFTELRRAVERAQSINVPGVSSTSTTLSLEMSDANKNPTIFDIVNGRIRMKEGDDAVVYLSTPGAFVESITFSNSSYPNTPESIQVFMNTDTHGGRGRLAFTATTSFYTTMQIRK